METDPTLTASECLRDLILPLYLERLGGTGEYSLPMNSLDRECLELHAAGVIDEASALRAAALERGEIFSIFEELRFVLYAAVAAITTGVGLVVKDNLDRMGPLTFIACLAVASAVCYATAVRTLWRRKARSIGGDYLLLLGALLASADLGYAESQFHWLAGEWQWHLLILAALHGVSAYALDSRLVLCLALSSLAAWFGIEGHAAGVFDVGVPSVALGADAIICAATILVWRAGNRILGGSAAFEVVFENFAANIGFWGALALCLTPATRLVGLVILMALAAAAIFKALRTGEEIFAVYGTAYTALTLCWLEFAVIRLSAAGLLLELITVVAGALSLWYFHRRANACASGQA